jgi:acetate---CoA ligase (ADP-forming)
MRTLTNQRALDLLKLYGVPVLNYTLVSNPQEITNNQRPFVLKIDSPSIIHKSERKGVVPVHDNKQLAKHFRKLRKHGQVIKQPLVKGHSFVIQVIKPTRGKLSLILGFGGVSTDIHNDFALRICPIKPSSAQKMIEELQTFNYFSEFEGKQTRFDVLADVLSKISILAKKEKLHSLEIDPFILNHKAGRVVDAKIVLD